MLKNEPNTVPASRVLHHSLLSLTAPAMIVMPATKTAVKPNIPMNEFAKPKAADWGLDITGEHATIGLRLQLATRPGSARSSTFSIDKITAALKPIAASTVIHLAKSNTGFSLCLCRVIADKTTRIIADKYTYSTLSLAINTATNKYKTGKTAKFDCNFLIISRHYTLNINLITNNRLFVNRPDQLIQIYYRSIYNFIF